MSIGQEKLTSYGVPTVFKESCVAVKLLVTTAFKESCVAVKLLVHSYYLQTIDASYMCV